MGKTSWREVFAKSKPYADDFDNYKVPDSKGVLPNRAEFTGDKFPGSGDPAKIELTHWRSGNTQYEKDKKVEEKAKVPSPITFDKNRREFVGKEVSERKVQSGWRNTFKKFSDVKFNQSPDGGIEIKVENEIKDKYMNDDAMYDENNLSKEDATTEANKNNWRDVLSSDADLDFSRKPDGTMTLKVKHLSEDDNFETDLSPQTPTTPGMVAPLPSQESFSPEQSTQPNAITSSAPCDGHSKDMKEYTLRKDKNLRLVARECDDKVGIFIEKRPNGVVAAAVKENIKVLASEVVERNGKQWRELINSSVWEAKYEDFLGK